MTLIVQYHSHNPDFIDSTHRDNLFWKELEGKFHPATFHTILLSEFIFYLIYVIEGQGVQLNEAGEEQPLKAGDFALVNPEGLTQVIPAKNTSIATRAISLSR